MPVETVTSLCLRSSPPVTAPRVLRLPSAHVANGAAVCCGVNWRDWYVA